MYLVIIDNIKFTILIIFECAVPFLFFFFGGFQCPSVKGCSTASFYFGALTGGNEHTSFSSAILTWKPQFFT